MLRYDSILGKLRLIGLGNLHEVLNKVIDLNSPAAVAQQIRDLRTAAKSVDGSVDKAISAQRTLKERKAALTTRSVELNKVIDQVLGDDDPTNDNLAVVKQRELDRVEAELKTIDEDLPKQIALQATHEELKGLLEADIQDLEHQLEQLRSAEVARKANEEATAGLEVARQIRESRAGLRNNDSALARAKQRQTESEVALERAMNEVRSGSAASEADVLARAKIEERKKRLAAQKSGAAA